jgi:sugar lactone lactonase YvrE
VAVDTAGNVFVADSGNGTIRKITPGGVVTTLAGTANSSDGSTDGIGAAARFRHPMGVAVDTAGNVFVAEGYDGSQGYHDTNTIRKITPGGVVTTLAGTAYSYGSADGTGTAAQFNCPNGVAVDLAGNVYVADSGNSTIRKITPAGVVTTLAGAPNQGGNADGTGSAARFGNPQALAVDAAGNVYVADSGSCEIRKITPAGVVTTLGGSGYQLGSADGLGGAARFNNPQGVAVDGGGNVYVADSNNSTIRLGAPTVVAPVSITTQPPEFEHQRRPEHELHRGCGRHGALHLPVADAGHGVVHPGRT